MEELQNLTPLYNKEFYLAYLCGEDVELPIPDGNTEHYLAYLCGMDVPIPDPLYTKEFYLAYKCGMDVELPEPGPYRIDQYLAKWCGMDVEVPEPMYRIEYWLAQLANSGELKTVSGNPISVSDALARPAESLVIEILPQQDLHGYDNPWPAGGGKNLFDPDANPDKWISADGSLSSVTGAKTSQKVYTNGAVLTYTVSNGDNQTSILCIAGYDENDTLIDRQASNGVRHKTFTTTAEMSYILAANYSDHPTQLESGSTVTSFEPYENLCPISGFTGVNIYRESAYDPDADPTYSIDWTDEAGTVYGGSLDVTSGVLTVNREMFTKTSCNGVGATAGCFYVIAPSPVEKNPGLAISTYLQTHNGSGNTAIQPNFSLTQSGGMATVIWCRLDSTYTTKAEVDGYLSSNPLTIVCKLDTPITIQLTPTEIQMLLGNNVLWNDINGDMTLEYLADGPAEDIDALQILLGNRYVNNGEADEATDREALDILLGGNTR